MRQAEEDLLVLAAQQGHQRAFRMLFRQYDKALLRYAFRICRDREMARDAVQDAWLAVAGNLRKLDDPRGFRGFLYRITHWRAVDQLRSHMRRGRMESPLEDDMADASTDAQGDDDRESLHAAINRLPTLERHMIRLFYLEDLRVAEIAQVLDIPAGTVKSRLNRARRILKERFDD